MGLYIGGQGEFGLFAPDELGRLNYTNISKELPDELQGSSRDIWDIHTISNQVFFRARNYIFVLDEYNHLSQQTASLRRVV